MGAITESLAGMQLEPRVREFLDSATAAAGASGRPDNRPGDGGSASLCSAWRFTFCYVHTYMRRQELISTGVR